MNGRKIKTSVERVVYVLAIQAKAALRGEVMYPKSRTITEPYSRRSMT